MRSIRPKIDCSRVICRWAPHLGVSTLLGVVVATLVFDADAIAGKPAAAPNRAHVDNWYEDSPLAKELSQLTEEEYQVVNSSGLLEFSPVAIPYVEQVVTQNDYYDWPIATKIEDTLVVLFDRRRYHFGQPPRAIPKTNSDSGIRMITTSSDGGESWSSPVDVLAQAGTWPNTPFGQWGGGLGVHDGVVYLAINQGVYRSSDKGITWKLVCDEPVFNNVPRSDCVLVPTTGKRSNESPNVDNDLQEPAPPALWAPAMRITFDRVHGMVIWTTSGFKQQDRDGKTGSDYGKTLSTVFSPDFGETWHYEEQALPDGIWINEITPLQHCDKMSFFLRHGARDSYYAQAFSPTGWFPFEFGITNVGPVMIMGDPGG